MDEVHVIGPNHDGADLRRQKAKNPRHIRCSGHGGDDKEINLALSEGRSSFIVSMSQEEHERIFGRKD